MKASHVIAVLNICKRGDAIFLKKLLSSNCNFEEVKDRKGRNALHYCAEPDSTLSEQAKPDGRLSCARLLLESNFHLEDQPDFDGFLPFHHVVIHGNMPLVQLFLSFNVDVNCLVQEGGDSSTVAVSGRTALHLAVIYANYEMLDFLLTGSYITESGEKQTFEVDVGHTDAQSATILHYAVQLPEAIAASMIKCIMEKSSMDINSVDAHKRTPLIWAATIGAASATSMLIELGADMNMVEESGLTALHCAASRGHNAVVQAILNHLESRDDERSQTLNARDADGCTPVFYSVTMGHKTVTKKLLEAGADASAKDSRGRGLFHCASRSIVSGGSGTIDLLIERGVDPCETNTVGDTALHEACAQVSKDYVAKLLKLDQYRQESINMKNSAQQTPLQIATQNALRANERVSVTDMALDICVLLCQSGAEIQFDNQNLKFEDDPSPMAMVNRCLKVNPKYQPAIELRQIFTNSTDPQLTRQENTENENINQIPTEIEDTSISERALSEKEQTLNAEDDLENTTQFSNESDDQISRITKDEVHTIVDEQIQKALMQEPSSEVTPPAGVTAIKPIALNTARTDSTSSLKNNSSRTHSTVSGGVSRSTKHESWHSNDSNKQKLLTQKCSHASQTVIAPLSEKSQIDENSRHSTDRSRSSAPQSHTSCSPNQRSNSTSLTAKSLSLHQIEVSTPVNFSHTGLCTSPLISASSSSRSRVTMVSAYTQTSKYHQPQMGQRSVSPLKCRARNSERIGEKSLLASYNISPVRIRKLPGTGSYKPFSDIYQRNLREIYQSTIAGRQRMPLPTITPYLNPVAKWPRAMASMMLAGEVSPLYAQRALNHQVTASRKQTLLETKRNYPVRGHSTIEARFQLSLAEQDFAKLAQRVLDQYDTMVQERQRLWQAKKSQLESDQQSRSNNQRYRNGRY